MSSTKYTGADIVAQYNKARAQAKKDSGGSRVSNATLTEAVNKQLSGNTKAQEYIQSARASNQEVQTAQQAINNNPSIATQRENSYERMLTRQYQNALNNLNSASTKSTAVTKNAASGASMSDNNLAAQIKGANLTAKLKGQAGDTEGKTAAKTAAETYQKLLDARKSAVSSDGTIQNVKTTTNAQQENLKYANRNLDYAGQQLEKAAENLSKNPTQETVQAYSKAAQYYSDILESVSTDTHMTTYAQEAASNKVQEYIRENASEELGEQLQQTLEDQEARVKQLKKEADKLLNKGDAEGYNQKMAEAKALETSTQTSYIRDLIQLNDDYVNNSTNISKMTDQDFQTAYSGYTAAKEEAQSYEDEAAKYLKLADQALARKDMTAYARYTALAEQERSKAEEALSEYGDLDKESEYTIENRLSTLELESKAKEDLDMKWYVDLGEKSTFVPTSRTLSGNLPIDSESGSMDTPAATQLLPQMSEDEKRVYNYYLGKQDTESAQKYFTLLEPTLEERYMTEVQSKYQSFTTEHPVLGTAANAISAATFQPVMGALGTMESAAKGVKETLEGTYTPPLTNTLMQTASAVNEATVEGLSQKLVSSFGLSEESASFWAGTVVSVLNNAAQSGAFRIGILSAAKDGATAEEAVEAVAKMGKWVPLTLMSTTAATDTIREQLASGNDIGRSLLYGGVVGAMEAITEKIGVDTWVDMATGGLSERSLKAVYSLVKLTGGRVNYTLTRNAVITALGLGKQILSEGGEEVISQVVDTLADIAINGDNSECSQVMWNYILQGYTEAEARVKTFKYVAEQVGYSFLGGAVSGGIFGLATIPSNLRTGTYIGKSIINQGTDLDYVAAGLKYDADTETYKIAKTISDKLDRAEAKGETYLPKAGELTQLALAMEEDSRKAAAETPSITLEETKAEDGSLSSFETELLDTGTVTAAIAEDAGAVMEKIVSGETVTDSDIKNLRADIPKVRELLNQKLGASLETGSTVEVRTAIEAYQAKTASAGTQAEGMKNGSQIIREAIPGAKALANADSEAQVEAAFSGVEAAAQANVAAQEAQNSAYAAAKAQGDIEAIARDVGKGNLNYGTFSSTYKEYFPAATSKDIRNMYKQANVTYKQQGSALIGVDGDTMLYFSEDGAQEISRESLRQWIQEATGNTPTDTELEDLFHLAEAQKESGKDGQKVFSLDELWDQVQEKESTPNSPQYSIDESFAEKLDAWDGKSNLNFKVGTTSDVLKSIGVRDTSIVWRGRKIAKILEKHSGMTLDIIKQVPNILEDPIVILKSQQSETRLSIFGEVNDANGVPVTAILELQPTGSGGQLLNMSIIASAYGKDVNLKGFIEKSGVVYLDTDKNRTETWLQGRGLKLPLDTTMLGSVGSVTYQGGNVKIDSVPWSQLTQTEATQQHSLDAEANEGLDTQRDTVSEGDTETQENAQEPVSQADTAGETQDQEAEAKPQEQKAPKERILSAGEYSQENPNKVAEWLAGRATKLFAGKGIDSVTVSYDMSAEDGNGYYLYKDGKAEIVLNGQKGEITRDGQHYTAQQNISFIIGHELTHRGQTGSVLTDTTGDFTGQVISAYQAVTGVTDDQVDEEIQKRFQRYRNYAAETGNIDLSDIDLEYGRKEYAADCMGEMMTKYNLLRKMASQDRNLVQQALDKVMAFADKARDLVNKLTDRHVTRNLSEAKIYAAEADTMAQLLRDGLSRAEGIKNTATEGGEERQYSLVGKTEDGIEVYETSEETKKLSYSERAQAFLSLMENEYKGRTAKFKHNGNVYYARFDDTDVRKNIWGDKKSDKNGWKAKINTGAEGNIFELVENAEYDRSSSEQGKTTKAHEGITTWDYYIKTVQIDGRCYDLLANVRKSADGEFVYSIQLRTNKNIAAAPPLASAYNRQGEMAALNGGVTAAASGPSVAENQTEVNMSTGENSENRTYSLDEEWEDDLPISGEETVSGFDAYRNEDGIEDTLEDGTRLLGKKDSQDLARELRNSFGSRMRISDLSTSLRQIADTADGIADFYKAAFLDSSEATNERWNEQYAPVEAMAYELADEIIENGETGGPLDTETHAVLREALTGDRIYVPENLRQDVAEGLGYESWGQARKARFDVLGKTVSDISKGTSVDVIYNNLVDSTPFAVSGKEVNPAAQLVEMIQAYDKAEKPSDRHNTLALTEEQRRANRKQIAERITSKMIEKASILASQEYDQYLADQKAQAERLSQEAARKQARADRLNRNNRNTEGAAAAAQEAERLQTQAQEAKLLGQTDEETIREGLEENGIEIKTRQEAAAAAAAQQKTETQATKSWSDMDPQERLDSIMKQVMAQNSKGGTKVSKLNSNTFTKGAFFNEAERAAEGLGESDMDYKVVTEKESMQEAADRLKSDYMYWFETLPKKESWSAKDFDTAMMILHQVQTESRKTGDTSELSRWANLIQPHTTEAGRMFQACKKYTRTAEYATIKMVENLDETYINVKGDSKLLKQLQNQSRDLSKQLTAQNARNQQMDQERQQLQDQIEKLRAELAAQKKEGKDLARDTDKLQTQTARDLTKLLEAMDQMAQLERAKDAAETDRDKAMDELQKMLVDVSNLSRKNGEIVREKVQLEQQLKRAQERYDRAKERNQKLQDAIEKLRNGEDTSEALKEIRQENETLQREKEELEKDKAALGQTRLKNLRTNSQKDRNNNATNTGRTGLDENNKALVDTLNQAVTPEQKNELIKDICEFGNMLDSCKEGDKQKLVEQIMEQARVRGMKPGKGVERNLMKQDFTYLHNFAFTQLANIADDYTKRNGAQKLSTWQYIAQLLNFRTSARNIVSNTAFYGVNGIARNLAAPVDLITSIFTKKRTTNFSTFNRGEESRHAAAMDRATRSWLETRLDVDVGTNQGKYGEGSRRTFKVAQKGISHALGRTLSQLEKVNGYSLNVSDEFFKGAIYQSSINSYAKLVANGMMTQEEAENFATQDMLYATFQDDTLVGKLLNKLHNGANLVGFGKSGYAMGNDAHDFGLGDILCKYRGVPGALIERSIEFSPAGYLKATYYLHQLAKSGGTDTTAQRNFVLNVGRATTGTGLIAMLTWAALNGIFKRDDEENKDVAAMERAEGHTGTQINTSAILRWMNGEENWNEWQDDDDLWDIGFLDPSSSMVTMATRFAQLIQEDSEKDGYSFLDALKAMKANIGDVPEANAMMTIDAFSDLSMMDTLNDLFYAIYYSDDEATVMENIGSTGIVFAKSTLTGFQSSFLRQVAQASDNNYRDTTQGSNLDQLKASLMVNIPGLRQQVPTKLDNLGNEKTYSDNTLVNAVNALLNPGKYAKYSQSALQKELKTVYDSTGDASFYPARNGASSVNFGSDYTEGSIKLTDEQKRTYLQDTGEMYQKFAAEIMGQDYYQNATANEKADMLKEVKSYAEYTAKQKLWETLHGKDKDYTPYENSTWSKLESVMGLGIGMGEAYGLVQDMTGIDADKDADGKNIKGTQEANLLSYLDGLGYDDNTKMELYEISGKGTESGATGLRMLLQDGFDFTDVAAIRTAFNEYTNDKEANGTNLNEKDAYSKWLYDNGYDLNEIEAINEVQGFWNQSRQESDAVLTRLVESGMDYDDAFEIANTLKGIEAEDESSSVTTQQKYETILGSSKLTDEQKQAAIAAVQGNSSMFGDMDSELASSMLDAYSETGNTGILSMNVSNSSTFGGVEYEYDDEMSEAYKSAYLDVMNSTAYDFEWTATYTNSNGNQTYVCELLKEYAQDAGKYAALQAGGVTLTEELMSNDTSLKRYQKVAGAQKLGISAYEYAEIYAGVQEVKYAVSKGEKAAVKSFIRQMVSNDAQYNYIVSCYYSS